MNTEQLPMSFFWKDNLLHFLIRFIEELYVVWINCVNKVAFVNLIPMTFVLLLLKYNSFFISKTVDDVLNWLM